MAPKAKAVAKGKAKPKARAGVRVVRGLPAIPAPLVPEQWYLSPAGQAVVDQLQVGHLLQAEVGGGSMLVEVLGIHPRDGHGVFIESGFRGGSTVNIQKWGEAARTQGRDLLVHLCAGVRACPGDAPGRLIVHVRRFRLRELRNVAEAWFEPGPAPLPPAAERDPAPAGATEEAVMAKARALRDRVLSLRGEPPGGPVEEPTDVEAHAVLEEAERALKEEEKAARGRKRDVRQELATRAVASGSRRRSRGRSRGRSRRRRRRGSSSDSRSSSGEAPGSATKGYPPQNERIPQSSGGVSDRWVNSGPVGPYCYNVPHNGIDAIIGGESGIAQQPGAVDHRKSSRFTSEGRYSISSGVPASTVQGRGAECGGRLLGKRSPFGGDTGAEGHRIHWGRAPTCSRLRESRAAVSSWGYDVGGAHSAGWESKGAAWRRERRDQGLGLGTRPGSPGRGYREASPCSKTAHGAACRAEVGRGGAELSGETHQAATEESATESEEEASSSDLKLWLFQRDLTSAGTEGYTLAALGPVMCALSEQLLDRRTGPTHASRDWRELLPLPRLQTVKIGESIGSRWGEILGVGAQEHVTQGMRNEVSWTVAVANGINLHHGCGLVRGEPSSAQWTCLGLLHRSCKYFCDLPHGVVPGINWKEHLLKKGISYSGEVLDYGEQISWGRTEPGLPPFEHCAAVDAVMLAEGPVREYLLHPERAVVDVTQLSSRPRPGRVCVAQNQELQLFRGLLARNLVGVIEESECLYVAGEVLVNGLFAVPKVDSVAKDAEGRELGTVQRLIMNLTASNQIFLPMPADIATLPTMNTWRSIVLPPECDIEMAWEDLKGAFYLLGLPSSWCKYFAFNLRLSSSALGISGTERWVRVGARVIPMGWQGAVGLCQYLHRRLVALSHARHLEIGGPEPLPLEREARKDRVFPFLRSRLGGH
eukprot:6470397-Amphidinium_carterae.1